MATGPYTFLNMQQALQPILWPTGEQENLVGAHRQMMVEALIDLQKWDKCLQINNTQVIPQCDTLFKCGYTVTDAPRGRINRLYTLDKVNQTTGLEDPTVPTDWCSVVDYRQVDYTDLDRYVSQALAGQTNLAFWAWWNIPSLLAGVIAFPTCWAGKYRTYPPPTDAGLSGAPFLPAGFHYAQTSTDTPNGVRAQFGMWAIKGGQIYVAPWIQSTETIVIEWDGVKTTWADTDLIDSDALLQAAVEWYVRWQQALKYDKDYDAANAAVGEYNENRAKLIHECREQTDVKDSADAANSVARGASLVVPTFTNNPQAATASCPTGTTGSPVSYTVQQGTVVSTVSQADADARAQSLALQMAGQQLACVALPVTYYSVPQSYTATCGNGTGAPVTVKIPAGQFTSTLSQSDANSQALASAQAQAQAELTCTYQSTAAAGSVTVSCPAGTTGSSVTVNLPAGYATSTVSQADANAKATAAATVQANAQLVCNSVSVTTYLNTAQSVPQTLVCIRTIQGIGNVGTGGSGSGGGGTRTVTLQYTATVPAGQFSSTTSQSAANTLAYNYGVLLAQNTLQNACAQFQATGQIPTGVSGA
jgi:hypothetical protein